MRGADLSLSRANSCRTAYDMLVPYVALAGEGSAYLTRLLSGHLESNVWLVEEILGVKMGVSKMGKCYRISR